MPRGIHRREMLRNTTLAGLGVWLAGSRAPGAEGRSPNEKLNIAFIGCGGQGETNLKQIAAAGQNVVALCDVDQRRAAGSFGRFTKARQYRDFRRMFAEISKEIDAVVVSTPDHMHAPISLAAMKLGKHVYCEKPLTWSIAEARLMAKTAKEQRLATQMGTQGMGGDRSRAGIEVIRSGVLGEVAEMHVWTDRASRLWPQGVDRPRETPPVPKELDWDLWLGAAPERPYNPAYCPFVWRGWKDFGTGAVGDMGIHNAAMCYAGLGLGLPKSVEIVETSGLKSETYPAWSLLKFGFPAAGGRGPVMLYWYEGGKKPPASLIGGHEVASNGAIVIGNKATLYSIEWTGGDWHLLPEDKFRDYQPPAPTIPRAPQGNHHQDWIRACTGGEPSLCRFEGFASELTETLLVGVLALRIGEKIEWDAGKMQAIGCPAAQPYIEREPRKGWSDL